MNAAKTTLLECMPDLLRGKSVLGVTLRPDILRQIVAGQNLDLTTASAFKRVEIGFWECPGQLEPWLIFTDSGILTGHINAHRMHQNYV